jgi:hypothetical protein
MQNGSPAVTVCYCPNCGTAIWKDFWESGGKWNIRPQGLHAGIRAGAPASAYDKIEAGLLDAIDIAREIAGSDDWPKPWEEAGVSKATWYRRKKG